MWNLVVAGILFALGAYSFYASQQNERRSQDIERIQSTHCKDVEPGRLTEVKGTLKLMTPLEVPDRPGECAYYKIERKQLSTKTRREPDGKIHTTDEWETVEARTESRRFLVEDDTGSVVVDPAKAEVDAPLVVDTREEAGGLKTKGFGMNLSLGGTPMETRVWALVAGQPIYVLGQAEKDGERIVLRSGAEKLLVSYKSEEELLRNARQGSSFGKVAAVFMFLLGILAFLLIKG